MNFKVNLFIGIIFLFSTSARATTSIQQTVGICELCIANSTSDLLLLLIFFT